MYGDALYSHLLSAKKVLEIHIFYCTSSILERTSHGVLLLEKPKDVFEKPTLRVSNSRNAYPKRGYEGISHRIANIKVVDGLDSKGGRECSTNRVSSLSLLVDHNS